VAIQKTDFVIIDYTGKVKETGEVFDTTSEEIAKENKLYKQGDIYESKLIVVGEGWVLKSLDEALLTFKLIPIRRLAARGISPRLGAQIEYDKKLATVRTMGSGRVTLDFNPPLAGKTLVYEVTVEKQLKTDEEKISALIHRRIPVIDVEKFKLKTTASNLTINMPDEAFYVEGIQLAKRGIAMDIQRFVPALITVQFVESFVNPEVAAKAKESKKKPAKKTTKTAKKVTTKKTETKAKTSMAKKTKKAPAKKAEKTAEKKPKAQPKTKTAKK
jgi:peptidylprolyl isomerase